MRQIKTDAEHRAALVRIDQLWNATAGMPELVELNALVAMVVAYEEERHQIFQSPWDGPSSLWPRRVKT